MAIRSSSGFSHLRPQNITYTTERVEEKRPNKHRLKLASSARREKFVTLLCSSLCICRLSRGWWLCGNFALFERNSHKVTRNADSSSHVGQPGVWIHTPSSCSILLTALFCWLLSSAFFSILLWSLDCRLPPDTFSSFSWLVLSLQLWDLPSLVLFRSRRKSRAQTLFCGFRAKTDKGIFWLALTHTHTHTTNVHIVSHFS